LDKSLKDLSVNDRYDQRIEILKPKLEAFFIWCELLTAYGKLGTAITYTMNQKERMMNVLEDGRLVLSNNLAERGSSPSSWEERTGCSRNLLRGHMPWRLF